MGDAAAPGGGPRITGPAALLRTRTDDAVEAVVELLTAAADAALLSGRLALAERHRASVLEVQRLR